MPGVDSRINGPRCLFTATVSPGAVLPRKQRLTKLSHRSLCSIVFMLQCSLLGIAVEFLRRIFFHTSSSSSLSCCHPFWVLGKLVLNWVIRRDSPSEDWMAQSWGGLTFLFQSLQSQRWTGQIEISTNGYVWECTHCDSRARCCAKLWGNQTEKLQVETLFHLGTLKRSSKKKLPQMSHEPSV